MSSTNQAQLILALPIELVLGQQEHSSLLKDKGTILQASVARLWHRHAPLSRKRHPERRSMRPIDVGVAHHY